VYTESSEENKLLQNTVREFVEEQVIPVASALEEREEFPQELVAQLAKLGLMGMIVPQQYGGAGASAVAHTIVAEELARGWASLHIIFSANNSLACEPILRYGDEGQKRRYLTPMAQGKALGCYGLTEPEVGSDAAALTTQARLAGDKWELSGTKMFITNAAEASICVVFARTSGERHKGISAFVFDTEAPPLVHPGVSVRKISKMGLKSSSFCEINFDNCLLPQDSLLGELGEGFKVAMTTLDGGRINIASQAVGIARAAFEESLSYARARTQFGQAIFDFQAIKFMLTNMATGIEAARALTLKAAALKDQGLPFTKEASQAKLFASEMAIQATVDAIRILGGYGYTKEFRVERYLRDAMATVIYEGTSQIQNLVIARHLA
jgi:acyl-CoA dehydrogenase